MMYLSKLGLVFRMTDLTSVAIISIPMERYLLEMLIMNLLKYRMVSEEVNLLIEFSLKDDNLAAYMYSTQPYPDLPA